MPVRFRFSVAGLLFRLDLERLHVMMRSFGLLGSFPSLGTLISPRVGECVAGIRCPGRGAVVVTAA
jgi:hypothetical protein